MKIYTNEKYDIALGYVIRKRRKELKMTQEDLAKAIGATRSSVSYYESGSRTMTASTFFEICDAIRLSASEVVAQVKDIANEQV